jgi:hypothetical protein
MLLALKVLKMTTKRMMRKMLLALKVLKITTKRMMRKMRNKRRRNR